MFRLWLYVQLTITCLKLQLGAFTFLGPQFPSSITRASPPGPVNPGPAAQLSVIVSRVPSGGAWVVLGEGGAVQSSANLTPAHEAHWEPILMNDVSAPFAGCC